MGIENRKPRKVAIVGGIRVPFCKQGTDYSELRIVDLLTAAMKALVDKYELKGAVLGDVAAGTVFDHPSIWNLSREAVIGSGLSPETPAQQTARACATSLDASINIANKIALGQIECGIAAGAESMSDPAIYYRAGLSRRLLKLGRAKSLGQKLGVWKGLSLEDLKPGTPPGFERSTGKTMGEHCEEMVKEWGISRSEQDEIALASHLNAAKAFKEGFYSDLVVPFQGVQLDNTIRGDTTLEKLSSLKPAFDRKSGKGTITAGNSSPLTDGGAAVLLASEEWAKARGLPVLAYLSDFEVAAIDVHKEGLLMAPAYAIPRMLKRNNLKLQDFDFYEIHEAFAGQVACTLKAWESSEFCRGKVGVEGALGSIDRKKLNVVGGSTALGHPFGATGARLVATLAKLLSQKGSGRGLISICAGGGMGTVAILER